MECFKVTGGRRLNGEVQIQGAKNAVLPILAASVLNRGESIIHNCPDLTDVRAALEILESVGCKTDFSDNTAVVDSGGVCCGFVADELMLKMRSSVIFCGGLMSVCKNAELTYPGGCELGARPVDLHIKAFKDLGAKITESRGKIICDGSDMHSGRVYLDFPSVGATENAMLSAVFLPGTTTIVNAAKEPEIKNLQDFINSMGGCVMGGGTSVITIHGVKKLHNTEFTVMADRIVAATYMSSVASTGGTILLRNTVFPHIEAVASVLKDCGCEITDTGNAVRISSSGNLLSPGKITTSPYPGFPTDAQAIIMAVCAKASGTTIISENIFESRYKHVPELLRMGADIVINGKTAVVNGVEKTYGTTLSSYDLRGGAAMVTAALSAEGDSYINNIGYIDRGYEDICRDLSELGAECKRMRDGCYERTKDKEK